jgi:hypothetical protein
VRGMLQSALRWGVAKWQGSGLWSRRSQVRILPPQPHRFLIEPQPYAVEQFFEMPRFEQRDKLAELPINFRGDID